MARIRSLKPSFFKSEDLAALSFAHRLCYEGLWCWADRDGRLEDRPRRLKAEIFPYDDLDMDALLAGLAKSGFITRYEVNGRRYIAIPTFAEHQIPKRDERESVIPSPDSEAATVPPLDSSGTATVPRVGSRKVCDEEVGDRGVGTDSAIAERRDRPETRVPGHRAEDLRELWNAITKPPIPQCRDLTDKRRKHIAVRLREREFSEWAEIFRRVQASAFCRGEMPGRGGGQPWRASFDWIVESADNAVKVLEGKYDDREVVAPSKGMSSAAALVFKVIGGGDVG